MKRIITILTFISLSFYSCNSELDSFNNNPNDPESVTPNLLLSASEVATFSNHSSGLARTASVLTQHLTGTNDGQFGPIGRYDITEGTFNNEWNALYTDAMESSYLILRDFGNDNPYYAGMARVLTAINLGNAADFWNDVPYNESFRGDEGIIQPSYQTQEEIYVEIQNMLTQALSDFDQPENSNIYIPGSDDFIFGGDVNSWKTITNVLKARFALRLSNVNGSSAYTDAISYINASGISSNSEDMEAIFSGEGSSLNQWSAFQSSRANYLKMGATFMDLMINSNDPRLSFFATKDENGTYTGSVANDQNNTTVSNIGTAIASDDQNLGIVTYVEAKFIEAEAKFQTGDLGGAQVAFVEAVTASVEKVTGEVDIAFVTSVTNELSLEKIIEQKYIAMFSTVEPYNDFRRTGFPVLTPNSAAQTQQIPLRLPTVSEERLYNPNATVVSSLYESVWWDK